MVKYQYYSGRGSEIIPTLLLPSKTAQSALVKEKVYIIGPNPLLKIAKLHAISV